MLRCAIFECLLSTFLPACWCAWLQYVQSPPSRISSFLTWLVGRLVGTVLVSVSCVHVFAASVHVFLVQERSLPQPCRETQRRFPQFLLLRSNPAIYRPLCSRVFLARHINLLMSCWRWLRKQLKLRLETSTLIKQKKDAWSEVAAGRVAVALQSCIFCTKPGQGAATECSSIRAAIQEVSKRLALSSARIETAGAKLSGRCAITEGPLPRCRMLQDVTCKGYF